MDKRSSQPRLNAQILEEAAQWLVEFNAGDADPALQQEFHAWLRTSPEHVRAYLEIVPIWEAGAAMPLEEEGTGAEKFIVLGKGADNIVPLGAPLGKSESRPPRLVPTVLVPGVFLRPRFALAAFVALLCVVMGGWAWLEFGRAPTYATEVGEQRSITLADGSTIELNAHSKLRIRFSAGQRDVDLLEGQALFRVANDPARPFVVMSGGTQVRAVGTQFDVYRRKTGTTVTVLEGRVAVLPENTVEAIPGHPAGVEKQLPIANRSKPDRSLFVDAGEQVTVTATAAPRAMAANVTAAVAWTQRRLVFDDSTLSEVVEEFNRYNLRRIVVLDPALERFPISGAFSSSDPASLLRFLQAQPGIVVTTHDSEIDITTQR
jgi:transmembrane sensor